MLELKAGAFYETATHVAEIAAWVSATSFGDDKEAYFHEARHLDKKDKAWLTRRLKRLSEHLSTLDASVTIIAVQEAEETINRTDSTWRNAKSCTEDISNCLRRELSLTTLFVLESKERTYYVSKEPSFGADVALKYPTMAVFEIDEAAKCFALGRSTAAVFHLMRIMEIGIRTTARCLGILDPIKAGDRNWGNILKDIKADLDAHNGQNPTKTWAAANDKDLFESVYVSLDAVRVAWRNTTMHVENKYTADEAEHIFVAVRGFMRRLASRCDENGLPLA